MCLACENWSLLCGGKVPGSPATPLVHMGLVHVGLMHVGDGPPAFMGATPTLCLEAVP